MTQDDIKQLIRELLGHMGVAVTAVDVREGGVPLFGSEPNSREMFCISTPDSHLLIGAKGAHLFALNHLVKKMVAKKDAERQFALDVNNYQAAALENLTTLAKIMGERARSLKTNVELEPMSSYERMVVHSFFQEMKDLVTESVGEGERRRVVIKYRESTDN